METCKLLMEQRLYWIAFLSDSIFFLECLGYILRGNNYYVGKNKLHGLNWSFFSYTLVEILKRVGTNTSQSPKLIGTKYSFGPAFLICEICFHVFACLVSDMHVFRSSYTTHTFVYLLVFCWTIILKKSYAVRSVRLTWT